MKGLQFQNSLPEYDDIRPPPGDHIFFPLFSTKKESQYYLWNKVIPEIFTFRPGMSINVTPVLI
jgi:hypothetical protein